MSLLGTSQLRFLARTPWSTLTVLLGISLGVASVVAVHQISLRVTQSLQSATPLHLRGLSHLLQVAAGPTTADAYFDLRDRWRSGQLPGVRALLPIVEGQVVIGGRRTLVFATDWLAADGLQGGSRTSAEIPSGPDAIIADASLGVDAGDVLTVNGTDYPVAAVVDTHIGPALFTDIGVGQDLLGVAPTVLSYVGAVRLDPWQGIKDALETLLPGLSAGFKLPGESWLVDGWRVRGVASEQPALAFARSVIFNLGALGSLSLVVAWLLVYQVGVIWHRRRRLLMDRLFAMGVTRGELTRGFVVEFALLGVLATVIGVFTGVLLARLLSELSTAGIDVPGPLPGLSGWVLLKGALSGVGVSCLGGWLACRSEWAQAERSSTARGRRGLLMLGLCAVVAVGVGTPGSGLPGGFAAVIAVSLLVLFGVRPLLERLRRLSIRLPGSMLTRIGLREAAWYPRDLSVAVGALALAVATSMGVGLMVASFRADFASMLDQRLAHDLYLDGGGRDLAPVRAWLEGDAAVTTVQAYGQSRERLQQRPIELGYTRFTARESLRYGLHRALAGDEAMISERLARALNLGVGDSLRIRARPLRVVAVFRGFGDVGYRLLVDETTAQRLGIELIYDRLSVDVGADVDADTGTGHGARQDLGSRLLVRFADTFPALRIEPRAEMRGRALDIFDRTFAITTALTLLALLVAVLGMYNALLALRLNQAPSYRLLAAVGVGAGEQRALALQRAGSVGLLAVLLALPLGVALAWLLCNIINPRSFGWSLDLQLAGPELLTPLGLGLLAALLTGLLPMPQAGDLGDAET